MRLLKADHSRTIQLEGVAAPSPRPVDIDEKLTGFEALRTLRIYRFEPPAVIDGHAEEDEVFIVALSGTVDLVMTSASWSGNGVVHTLTAADTGTGDPLACAAYLPPHAEYKLTPRTPADIAYARSTPVGSPRLPAVFKPAPRAYEAGITLLLDESQHAERLRMRLLQIDASKRAAAVRPLGYSQDAGEALLYVKTNPAKNAAKIDLDPQTSAALESWDTVAVPRGESPTLHVAAGSSVLGFMVAAI